MAHLVKWRVIGTDSESLSGVAPVCPNQDDVALHSSGDGYGTDVDPAGVYDCCPEPHIECWTTAAARHIANALNEAEAEPCS